MIDDAELVTDVVSVGVFRTNSSMRIFAPSPILQLFWWFNEMDQVLAFMLAYFILMVLAFCFLWCFQFRKFTIHLIHIDEIASLALRFLDNIHSALIVAITFFCLYRGMLN